MSAASGDGGPTETFAAALDRVGVELTRTDADGAADAVAAAVEGPAVGVPVDLEGVDLAEVSPAGDTSFTLDPMPAEIEAAETGVTGLSLGVADYGSVVVDGDAAGTEPASLFCERHVGVLAASDVVSGIDAAFAELGEHAAAGGSAVIATGPSATADMGDLVLGAHGPETVHVVLVEDR
ncbi:MAG: LUD domain-containing protein [Halobacteriaceae archaeon]